MRTFVIYEDFVVREIANNSRKSVAEIGRFKVDENGKTYVPYSKFKDHKNPDAKLHKVEIAGTIKIKLNSYFNIEKILERPESNHKSGRVYYKETCFVLSDNFGNRKDFLCHIRPDETIDYAIYQKFIKQIIDYLEDYQTFREMDLTNEIQEKSYEIERLKQQLNDMKD